MSADLNAAACDKPRSQPNPLAELLQRYLAVFKAAWERRDELAGPTRLADERAFLPAAISLQETPPHPAPRRFMLVICALFSIALFWSCIGQLDIVAVAQGRIVVSDRTKVIQPVETASVRAIHVKDGDRVDAGQLLIELDGTSQDADVSRIGQELSSAQSEALRTHALLRALTLGTAPTLDVGKLSEAEQPAAQTQLATEWNDIQARIAKLAAERMRRGAEKLTAEQVVAKLRSTLPLAQARERDYEGLASQGFIAGHATQDRRRERIEMERDLATAGARHDETQAALLEAQQQAHAFRAELMRSLHERQAKAALLVAQLKEEATKAEQRRSLTRLTAPVSGTVQQLAVHTTGGVVTPAQPLLIIVPDKAAITAEVHFENKDIGFVRVGQDAEVKLETLPFTRYGTIQATVMQVNADAITDEKKGAMFVAMLKLRKESVETEGGRIVLHPGMNLTAEVKTGRRRAIDFLLRTPMEKIDDGLKER